MLLILSDFLGNELNSALLLSPEIIKKTIGLQREQSFYHNLAKDSILYVWQVCEYANEYGCKILANDFWWVLESIKVNKYIGMKRVMSCLHIHVFISFSFLCLTLNFLNSIIHFTGTAIVKNKCYVFLASMLNSLCFIGNALSVTSNSYYQSCI